MTDQPKPPGQESSSAMFQALQQYAPGAIQAISETLPGTAQKTLEAQQQTAPGYAALQNQIYGQYGPEANRIGSEINNQNQLAAAQTEANVAQGPGKGLVNLALQEQQQLDPEYYKSRAATSDALNKWLSSYSPTELSGSELEQINRGISGRQGPLTPSALNTVKNAQEFGNAATQRWQNFGNAVLGASSALPGFKSGLTGFEIATRRPLTSNTGENRLSSPTAIDPQSTANNNFGFANNALSNIVSQQNAQINKTRSFDTRVNEAIGSLSGII